MPENTNQTDQTIENITNDTIKDEDKKITWRSFLKFSGFTISFILLSIILMVIGLIIFYKTGSALKENIGYWMIFVGVILFLLTVIFGFEKIE